MDSEEIKRLVAKSENAAVEFKRARGGVPADFWPSYSSFANTDGGVIILGVREKDGKRDIEGLADTEKIVADLWNAVNNPDKVSANVLTSPSIPSMLTTRLWSSSKCRERSGRFARSLSARTCSREPTAETARATTIARVRRSRA